jgi:hypothetical protein
VTHTHTTLTLHLTQVARFDVAAAPMSRQPPTAAPVALLSLVVTRQAASGPRTRSLPRVLPPSRVTAAAVCRWRHTTVDVVVRLAGRQRSYGCIRTRRHPWQPPDEASAKMPWFRSLVALRNRPPIPGVWCPCKQQCQCASCSDARAESLGLKFVVESDGADGVARLVAL